MLLSTERRKCLSNPNRENDRSNNRFQEEGEKTNSTHLAPRRPPTCGKKAWRGRHRPHRTLTEKKPEHLHQSTPHDRLGRTHIPEKWRTNSGGLQIENASLDRKTSTTRRSALLSLEECQWRDNKPPHTAGQGTEPTYRSPSASRRRRTPTRKQSPMSPDWAGKSHASATTASKTSPHFREHKEKKKTPRKLDRKRTTDLRPQHTTDNRRGKHLTNR